MKHDEVNHPSHYTDGKIEVIDFIEDKNLNFHRGQVVKYVSRAGKKDPAKELQDLEKAQWYLNREIWRMKGCPKGMESVVCSQCSNPVVTISEVPTLHDALVNSMSEESKEYVKRKMQELDGEEEYVDGM